jgi:hypothetical protein
VVRVREVATENAPRSEPQDCGADRAVRSNKAHQPGKQSVGFKPEFGYSQRWGHWVLDGYAGFRFFTTNPEFFSCNMYFPDIQIQTQQPIGTFEGHLS